MSTPNTVKTQLQNLIDLSNRTTGKSDTDLTDAVNTLVSERDSFIIGSEITEFYSSVTKVGPYAICGKYSMTNLSLPNATEVGQHGLSQNQSLKNVYIPQVAKTENYIFYRDFNLEYIDMPKIDQIGTRIFQECTGLKCVNLHNVQAINANTFNECTNLKVLILTCIDSIATLTHINAFTNTPVESGTGFIYVPRNLIESYKAATNWITFTSQFRVLEDYTVDGTIDGELDWDKVNGGAA